MPNIKILEEHYRKKSARYVIIARYRLGSLPKDLSQDVVQEAYTRAIKYLHRFNPDTGNFDAWFRTIFNNCTQDIRNLEQDNGIVRGVDENDIIYIPDEDDKVDYNAVFKPYKERDREILRLYFCEEIGVKGICDLLGHSDDMVRRTISAFFNNNSRKI